MSIITNGRLVDLTDENSKNILRCDQFKFPYRTDRIAENYANIMMGFKHPKVQ